MTELTLTVVLEKPTAGVDFGLQKGSGHSYEIIQKQRSTGADLRFSCPVQVKGTRDKDLEPKLAGPYVQGPAGARFLYIGIGTYAGQADSIWSRRLKIPLAGITWAHIDALAADETALLHTRVPGTGKDGSPNCATVKPFAGWSIGSKL